MRGACALSERWCFGCRWSHLERVIYFYWLLLSWNWLELVWVLVRFSCRLEWIEKVVTSEICKVKLLSSNSLYPCCVLLTSKWKAACRRSLHLYLLNLLWLLALDYWHINFSKLCLSNWLHLHTLRCKVKWICKSFRLFKLRLWLLSNRLSGLLLRCSSGLLCRFNQCVCFCCQVHLVSCMWCCFMIWLAITYHIVLLVVFLCILIASEFHLVKLFQFPLVHLQRPIANVLCMFCYLTNEMWTPMDLCLLVH